MDFHRDFDNKGKSQGISMPWVERACRHLCWGPDGVCSKEQGSLELQMPMQRGNAWDSGVSCGWGGAARLMCAQWLGGWAGGSPDLCVCCMPDIPSDPVLPRGQCWSRSHSWSTWISVQTHMTTGMLPALHVVQGKCKKNRIVWQSRNQVRFHWVFGCHMGDKSIVSTLVCELHRPA